MRDIVVSSALAAALVLALIVTPTALADGEAKAADLAWLAGAWRAEDGGIEEYWSPPAGGSLIGMARFFGRSGRVGMTELMTIAKGADGKLAYAVRHFTLDLKDHPAGAAAFALAEAGEKRAVFVLPQNDFPSKITYAREGEKLTVTLEGEQGGKPVKQPIVFVRVPEKR